MTYLHEYFLCDAYFIVDTWLLKTSSKFKTNFLKPTRVSGTSIEVGGTLPTENKLSSTIFGLLLHLLSLSTPTPLLRVPQAHGLKKFYIHF